MWTTNIQAAAIAPRTSIHDLPAVEPVILLAAVEEQLQRAERDRQQGKAEQVELALVLLGLAA